MTQTLSLDGWLPVNLNTLMRMHRHARSKALHADAQVIGAEAHSQGLVKAAGRRRVGMLIRYARGKTPVDPDAYFKSVLDALRKCGLLLEDNRHAVELGSVSYEEAPRKGLVITLEDLP